MEALAYRKNAVMVREALETGPAATGRETRAPPQRVHPRHRAGTNEYLSLWPVGRPEFCYRLFWVSFQFCWAGGGFRGRAVLSLPPRRAGEPDPDQEIQTSFQE